jgi:hypothetical protein
MRIRLFVVVAARAAEEEQNFLSVFSHGLSSYGFRPIVTTIRFGSCGEETRASADQGISPTAKYSDCKALFSACAAACAFADAPAPTWITIPVTPIFESSIRQSLQFFAEPDEDGAGVIILSPKGFNQPASSSVVANRSWKNPISIVSLSACHLYSRIATRWPVYDLSAEPIRCSTSGVSNHSLGVSPIMCSCKLVRIWSAVLSASSPSVLSRQSPYKRTRPARKIQNPFSVQIGNRRPCSVRSGQKPSIPISMKIPTVRIVFPQSRKAR